MRTYYVQAGTSRVPIYAFRAAPSHIHIAGGDLLTAEQWQRNTGAHVVVNGGYFDRDNIPLGLRVMDGKKVSSLRQADWGVFYIRNGKAAIAHTRDYKGARTTREAIQCGPRLVVNGKTTDLKPQWGRRTALGIDRAGRVVVAIAYGEITLDSWAQQWASRSGLDCPNALNLDGGGSTQLEVQTREQKLSLNGLWPVPDAITIR
jgi:uncharacterized protein YigE (DUF2233 family)